LKDHRKEISGTHGETHIISISQSTVVLDSKDLLGHLEEEIKIHIESTK
jgi:hypothetical protein